LARVRHAAGLLDRSDDGAAVERGDVELPGHAKEKLVKAWRMLRPRPGAVPAAAGGSARIRGAAGLRRATKRGRGGLPPCAPSILQSPGLGPSSGNATVSTCPSLKMRRKVASCWVRPANA